MGFNASEITTTGGEIVTYGTIGYNLLGAALMVASMFGAMSSGRKKRDARPQGQETVGNFNEVVYEILSKVDESGCAAQALCTALSIEPSHRTPEQEAVIELFHSSEAVPVPWTELSGPHARYQYASFIGQWALQNQAPTDQCLDVFPSCPFPVEEVINSLANSNIPCGLSIDNDIE